MKLYDYSKRRSPDKDIQFDQLDEEIRRIWDLLYNNRQQYPSQLGGGVSDAAQTYKPSFDNSRPTITRYYPVIDSVEPQTATIGINAQINVGQGGVGAFSSISNFTEAPYINVLTGATGGDQAFKRSRPGIILRHNIYFQSWVRIGGNTADSTHVGQFVGLSQQGNPLVWSFSINQFQPQGARIGFMRYNNAPDGESQHPWIFTFDDRASPPTADYGCVFAQQRLTELLELASPDPDPSNYYFLQFAVTWKSTDTFDIETAITEYVDSSGEELIYTNSFSQQQIIFDEDIILGACIENVTMQNAQRELFWHHTQVESYKPNLS